MKEESIPVASRITKSMLKEIKSKVLPSDTYLNMADYIRDLIRRDLEGRKQ